jgi:hypothetical protein
MSRFNDLYDTKALQESLAKANENGNGEFPEVPVGKYVVKVEKIELGSTKAGVPMGKIQFRIIEGDYKKQCLFYNQVLVGTDKNTGELSAFGIHNFNEFLKSLETNVEVKFKDFDQYADMLLDIAEDVEGLEYDIQYGRNNDFPTFKVLAVYED